jgi:hypothetical protein
MKNASDMFAQRRVEDHTSDLERENTRMREALEEINTLGQELRAKSRDPEPISRDDLLLAVGYMTGCALRGLGK